MQMVIVVVNYSIGKHSISNLYHSDIKRQRRHDSRIRKLLAILIRIYKCSFLYGRRISWIV